MVQGQNILSKFPLSMKMGQSFLDKKFEELFYFD